MKNFLWVLLILLPFFAGIYSQSDRLAQNPAEHWEVNFDETELEKWKKEKEFDYLVQETSTSWWTQFKGWLNVKYEELLKWIFGSYTPGSIASYFIVALPYLLLILSLAIMSWLFVRLYPVYGSPGNTRKKAEIYFSEEEKIVKSEDIQELIHKSVQNKNYRLAVRYYFLNSLQKLDELKIIQYKTEKTNADYLSEISTEELSRSFGRITRIYEYIWYGDFHVTEEEFKMAENTFLKFENLQSSGAYA